MTMSEHIWIIIGTALFILYGSSIRERISKLEKKIDELEDSTLHVKTNRIKESKDA